MAMGFLPRLRQGLKLEEGRFLPGYGFTLGSSAIFHLLPTPITIGMFTQFNWVSGVIGKGTSTYWTTIGLVFGVNLQDKLPGIFDIDFKYFRFQKKPHLWGFFLKLKVNLEIYFKNSF